MSDRNQTLYCRGDAGAGKTMLAAKIVDDLFTTHKDDLRDVGICFLYCSFNQQNAHTLENLLATFLKQLLQHRPLPESIQLRYEMHHHHRGLRIDEILEELQDIIKVRSKVYAIVDGLDECAEDCRNQFLEKLESLRDQTAENGTNSNQTEVKILVTSRPLPEITSSIRGSLLTLPIYARDDDIRKYLDAELGKISKHYWSGDSWIDVKGEIVSIAEGK